MSISSLSFETFTCTVSKRASGTCLHQCKQEARVCGGYNMTGLAWALMVVSVVPGSLLSAGQMDVRYAQCGML